MEVQDHSEKVVERFLAAFGIVAGLIMMALGTAQIVNWTVAGCVIIASVITFVSIARIKLIKKLSLLFKLPLLLVIVIILSLLSYLSINWMLKEYQQKQITQKPSPIEAPKEPVARIPEKKEADVKLIFKNSPLFTSKRKQQITAEINKFRNYLLRVGFDVPRETPPIGISRDMGLKNVYSPHGSALEHHIMLGKDVIDDPTIWRKGYAYYVFTTVLGSPDLRNTINAGNRQHTIWVFQSYFLSSYENQRPQKLQPWIAALWDIRDIYGQDFVDRSLFYMSKLNPMREQKDFNKYFSDLLYRGIEVLDNEYQTTSSIIAILKKHNLQ